MGSKKKATAAKKATKPVEKSVKTPKEETTVVKNPAEKTAEEVKPIETKPQDEKTTKTEKTEKPKKGEKEKVIIPEVVDDTKKKEEEKIPTTLSQGLNNLASKERMDVNRQIDLMKMIREDHIANPDTKKAAPELYEAMTNQYNVMKFMAILQYNAQLGQDLKTLGVVVSNRHFEELQTIAMETLGITLKGLPNLNDPKQTVIDFDKSDIPEEVKKQADKEAKEADEPIPDPDPKMSEEQKIKTLGMIFSRTKSGGLGSNLITGIEWARKSYSFKEDEKKAVILANIFSKEIKSNLLNGVCNMVAGKFNREHSILGAHGLMKSWCKEGLTDSEIAELMYVIMSKVREDKIDNFNRTNPSMQSTVEKELELASREWINTCTEPVIQAILEGKESTIVKLGENTLDINVDTASIRKTLISGYGDSNSILKSKLNEILKYYVSPIVRLSKYVDKSAYSK